MIVVVTLYTLFICITLFAPLRWAIPAYVLLACLDFSGNRDSIGLLNAFRGFAVPLFLLWRLRKQAGHRTVILAPIAWSLLIIYAGIASSWSFFPTSAIKLVGHMTGTLLIAFVFARAAKGGYLTSNVVIPVTVGTILLALLQLFYFHNWTGEPTRFNVFTSAQGFAAYLAALYCMALCAPGIATIMRALLCSALAISLVFNGSRIWFAGILLATVIAFVISGARAWAKILSLGAMTLVVCFLVIARGLIAQVMHDTAPSNRIVAAVLAAYEGESNSQGLGTLRFRREIDRAGLAQIEKSSITEFAFGHGTSNGALITGSLFRGYSRLVDPNRMVHDEWVRVLYEWGVVGFLFWCVLWGSIVVYAVKGVRRDSNGYAKPLMVYVPALLIGFAGENFIAGAGNAISVGFLMLFGLATLAHRPLTRRIDAESLGAEEICLLDQQEHLRPIVL